MKGVDTNILIRYITRDDSVQTRRAKQFLEEECTPQDPGYVNVVVLVEMAWVLERLYDRTEDEIAQVLDRLLRVDRLRVESRDLVRSALTQYETTRADFADCLLGQLNQAAGCTETLTFDQAAATLEAWRALEV